MQSIEIELKFPLLNLTELTQRLNKIAQPKSTNETQVDTYFSPEHKNFTKQIPISEWLRLRESKKGASINYKKWHNSDGAKTISCDEFETKIENLNVMTKILNALEFQKLITVNKSRHTWTYKDTEIAIDEVKELGNFIEIEAKGNFITIEDAKNHLYLILKELDAKIGEQDFEGYPLLLLKKNKLIKP